MSFLNIFKSSRNSKEYQNKPFSLAFACAFMPKQLFFLHSTNSLLKTTLTLNSQNVTYSLTKVEDKITSF